MRRTSLAQNELPIHLDCELEKQSLEKLDGRCTESHAGPPSSTTVAPVLQGVPFGIIDGGHLEQLDLHLSPGQAAFKPMIA